MRLQFLRPARPQDRQDESECTAYRRSPPCTAQPWQDDPSACRTCTSSSTQQPASSNSTSKPTIDTGDLTQTKPDKQMRMAHAINKHTRIATSSKSTYPRRTTGRPVLLHVHADKPQKQHMRANESQRTTPPEASEEGGRGYRRHAPTLTASQGADSLPPAGSKLSPRIQQRATTARHAPHVPGKGSQRPQGAK